jgi:hypothetical protein
MHHRQPEAQLLESIETLPQRIDHCRVTRAVVLDQVVGDRLVPVEQIVAHGHVPLSFGRAACGVDQRVGDFAHRGGHDGDFVSPGCGGDRELRRLRNTLGGPDGGAAEFHDDSHRGEGSGLSKRCGFGF